MRYEKVVRLKLTESFGRYAEDLRHNLVVEPQAIIELTPARTFEDSEWNDITRTVERMGGCWEHAQSVWRIPYFLSEANLPASNKRPNSDRLHIRSLTLRNLIFLHDEFKGKRPAGWKDVQSALYYFASNMGTGRSKYSKAACRDYLGALLALATV
jgi:hypothetical protein